MLQPPQQPLLLPPLPPVVYVVREEGNEMKECMTSVLGNLQFCWITVSFVELAGGMQRVQELL